MQNTEEIDWDYEWSYTSGELPSDERFIKSMTSNISLTEDGLNFDGPNAIMSLPNHNKIALYLKLNSQYKTKNINRGFTISLYNDNIGDKNKEVQIVFNGVNGNVQQMAGPQKIFGKFEFGEDCILQLYIDFSDDWNVMQNSYCIYNNGDKQSLQNYQYMWYINKSQIYTDNGMYGSEGYVLIKELKFKTYD